ncbi:MAG: chromate transporter [Absicoccus sp.]|uniref:chromate transporter n=1 Tax=Absicoccus sp. TaxID=2718527 RepID=UPI002A750686|nr:chromate transporter [Absicoccus sp.]MDY3036107.1 chromate transporter [Absicoccus sp.]
MDTKKLWKMFTSMFYLSACTFGGGYVIVSLMRDVFVKKYHWIDDEEMLDLVAIAQSSPGAIAVNGAIVVGYKLSGIVGVAVALVATILPPFLILSIVSLVYDAFIANVWIRWLLEGMQAGVVAIILSVCLDMGIPYIKHKKYVSMLCFGIALCANSIFHIPVVWIILCGMVFVCLEAIFQRTKK